MSSYGTDPSKWRMLLRRALRLSSASTTHHGHSLVSVAANIVSFALE
jgi:hypothetical protein